jgi:hypothetical protein
MVPLVDAPVYPVVAEVSHDEVERDPHRQRQVGDGRRIGMMALYQIVQIAGQGKDQVDIGEVGDQVIPDHGTVRNPPGRAQEFQRGEEDGPAEKQRREEDKRREQEVE